MENLLNKLSEYRVMNRSEINDYAIKVASDSQAKKRKVGAVLALDLGEDKFAVITSGFNFNPSGGACEDIWGNTLDTVVHAEVACLNSFEKMQKGGKYFNYFRNIGLYVTDDQNADDISNKEKLTMFVTYEPCNGCKAALLAAGIKYELADAFMKFDSEKPRMQLVPSSLGVSCARALGYGAKKYKVNNWRKAVDIEQYISALQRHFDAWREGEENDKESGLSHLDHMAANLCFIIELKNLPKLKEK